MTHLSGTQDPMLLQTAINIVNNPAGFDDGVLKWSQSYIDGGISTLTYEEIIRRAGVSIDTTTSNTNVVEIVVTQEADGQERLQNMQLEQLGETQEQFSLSLAAQQQQLQAAINANREYISEVNQRLSDQVGNLGVSVTEASQSSSGIDITSFLGGIGTGGLIAIGVVAFFILRGRL